MFYYLYGTLEINDPGVVVIDCGGVGYKLTTSLITSEMLKEKVGQKIKIFTHLAVREDGIELFGFESNEERECFNKLITVSGVGPKAAMSILSIMTPDNFALAVCTDDAKAISKASGIGGKTAARIILELKDKLSMDMSAGAVKSGSRSSVTMPQGGNFAEATEALMVLGYDKASVAKALADLDPGKDVGDLIRAALKKLAR
ncbi:MAG: Holliday junction branch migration protein RuvA [Clostridia bacterium]|nr:Holliday junction branch migration protein RuvA [Clostridia bacterium]